MALSPLADVSDLTARSPVTLTSDQQTRAMILLGDASTRIRRFCRQDFAVVTGDTVRLKPNSDFVTLPKRPVTGVSGVSVVNFDGSLTPIVGWAWDGGQRVYGVLFPSPIMINAPAQWDGSAPDDEDAVYTPYVEVTYSHGLAEVPGDLVAKTCELVLRVLLAPGAAGQVEGLSGETTGPAAYSMRAGAPGPSTKLTAEDKQELRDAGYCARPNQTIPLR